MRLLKNNVVCGLASVLALAGLVAPAHGDLVGHWKLDDGSGQMAADSSGLVNDGTLGSTGGVDANDPTWEASVSDGSTTRGPVLTFGGDSNPQWVDLSPHVGTYSALNQGTISAWFKTPGSGVDTIIAGSQSGDGSSEFRLIMAGTQIWWDVREQSGGPGLGGEIRSPAGLGDNQWHHAAVSVDAAMNANLYIDGSLVAFGSQAFMSGVQDMDSLSIGRNVDSSNTTTGQWLFDGSLSDVAVWNVPLTAGQVRDVYTNGVSADPAELPPNTGGGSGGPIIIDLHFNEEGAGDVASISDTIVDETGNHNGSVEGGTLEYVDSSGWMHSSDGVGLHFTDDPATANRVQVPNHPDFTFEADTGSFTIEAAIRTSQTDVGAIMSDAGGIASNPQVWLRLTSGALQFAVTDIDATTPTAIVTSDETLNDGLWHHIAAMYDADTDELRLYLDYELIETAPAVLSGSVNANFDDLMIGEFNVDAGGTPGGSRSYEGDMDFFRISRGALAPSQFVPEPSSLALLWTALAATAGFARRRKVT